LVRKDFDDKKIQARHKDLEPTLIRLPGGRWGDIICWNGNGVKGPPGPSRRLVP
jgi:hypothetical protein